MQKLDIWNQDKFEADLEYDRVLISIVLKQFILDLKDLAGVLSIAIEQSQKLEHALSSSRSAHALKGAAAQVRCTALAHMCNQLEFELAQNTKPVTITVADFTATVEKTEQIIATYQARSSS